MTTPAVSPLQQGAIPQHVAIIMDGNNRFARKHHLPQGAGHRAGKDQLDPIVEQARRLGVQVLTVFAFSSENWQRPAAEVELLMDLFAQTIREQKPRMLKHDIAMRFIGDRTTLSAELQALMADVEASTAQYTAMTLVIAVSYGGMWDMTQAARKLAALVQTGQLTPEQITPELMQSHVELGDLPPVDLLIRTAGDHRLSNFLLWQAAYAELYFTDTLWPEFSVAEFEQALAVFATCERRFGKTSEQVSAQINHPANPQTSANERPQLEQCPYV